MVGKTISHYKIVEKLGGGGMGVVYKSTDIKLNRTVALKFLPPELLHDPEAKTRFIREAQAASSLQHDNTCVIHDIEETDDGQLFICMEFYKGETLKKKIERSPLPIENVINYTSQIATGLSCAHHSKMIHRDIKPANIMITEDDEVKIVDFGLAHLVGQSKITKDGSTLGTIDYMSPEQTTGKKVDHRTDIWSLGVVLYEMVTGKLPFKGDYDQAVMYSIVNDEPDPPSRIRANIPTRIDQTVHKALQKDPTKRYQKMTDLLGDLKNVQSEFKERKSIFIPRFFNRRRLSIGITALILITAALIIDFFIPGFGLIKKSVTGDELTNKSIAVMICENRIDPRDENRLGEMITDALITDLRESRLIKVVSLQQLYDILKQMGKNGLKIIAKSEQLEVAKRAKVSRIVSASIGQLGDRYILTAQCIEVQSGEVLHSIEIPGHKDSIYQMIDSISTHIRLQLGIPEEVPGEPDRSIVEVTTHSTEAYRHYLAGEELAAKYDMKEAARAYKMAVTLDSTFATAYSRLANVYRFLRQPEKAKFAIDKAFRHSDHLKERERYEIFYRRALRNKDIPKAKEWLFTWIDRYPEDKLARYHLGNLYANRLQLYDEAIFQYKRAIDLDYDYRLAYNYLGYAYAHKGKKEEALAAFNRYLSLCPDEVNPYDSLGEVYMNLMGDYEKAELYFKKAFQINPDFAPQKLAELYQLKGQFKTAEALHRSTLYKETLISPGIKNFLLARLFYEKADYENAYSLIKAGKSLLPSYANLYWLSGLIHLKKNDIKKAEQDLNQLKKFDPESKNYFHLLGQIHLAKNNYQSAIPNLQKSSDKINFMAWYYYEHREFYQYELAEAYFEQGDLDKALKECLDIISYNPNWARTYYILGRVYENSESVDKAVEAYNSLLRVWQSADMDLPEIIYASQRLQNLR